MDRAFAKARKEADKIKLKKRGPREDRPLRMTLIMINEASEEVVERLRIPLNELPDLETLPRFYKGLVETNIGIENAKKAFGQVAASIKLIWGLQKDFRDKVRANSNDRRKLMDLNKVFYGRLSSIVKKNRKSIELLQRVAIELRTRNVLRSDLPTIVLAGFPNAGKSTLLSVLTNAKPEIASYPFTTKKISVGHFTGGSDLSKTFQLVDTPGLLDRPSKKRNEIEEESVLALKELADVILFLFDVSNDSKYLLEDQLNLFNTLKKELNKPFVNIITKAEITYPKTIEGLKRKIPGILEVSAVNGVNIPQLREMLAGYAD